MYIFFTGHVSFDTKCHADLDVVSQPDSILRSLISNIYLLLQVSSLVKSENGGYRSRHHFSPFKNIISCAMTIICSISFVHFFPIMSRFYRYLPKILATENDFVRVCSKCFYFWSWFTSSIGIYFLPRIIRYVFDFVHGAIFFRRHATVQRILFTSCMLVSS